MDDIEKIRPDWTNRRGVIKASLIFFAVLLATLCVTAVALAYFGKFGFYICLFATTVAACIFLTYICIIGSYVFGAQWETKNFLNTLTNIVPDFNREKNDPTDES